jgi:hypothetical protein
MGNRADRSRILKSGAGRSIERIASIDRTVSVAKARPWRAADLYQLKDIGFAVC